MVRTHGSISSAGSLTFSDLSESETIKTPPASPRSPACFTFDDSPASTASSDSLEYDQMALSSEAEEALRRLNLHIRPNGGYSFEEDEDMGTAPPLPTLFAKQPAASKANSRKPGLRMDLSSVRKFDIPSEHGLGAPLIGCLPTPPPNVTNFSNIITPRPPLASRFSDDAEDDDASSSSGRSSSPRVSPGRLSISTSGSANGLPTGPITPRTVDALDSFGISSSVSSSLLNRGKPREKPSSPTQNRFMPRSPLAFPVISPSSYEQSHQSNYEHSLKRQLSPLIDTREAKRLYHELLPGEKSRLADLLQTPADGDRPFDWASAPNSGSASEGPKSASSMARLPSNPYFVSFPLPQ